MSAAAKPKSAKPGGRAAVLAAEPDAATLLPPDLPAECPFPVTWRPAVFAVSAAEGSINLSAIKDAFKQLHVLSHISLSDLAARLDPADPLCTELAAAAAEGQVHAAAGEGASVPIKLAAKLLQRQFNKDESLAWKFELVRRRDQLARLEAEAQMAQDALEDAESAQAAATSRLEAVKARLPQPAPPPAVHQDTGTDAVAADEDPDLQEGGVPVPKLQLAQVEAQEVVLSPEQRRALTEAQAGLEAADNELSAAKTAASSADAGLAAAHASLHGPFHHYEPYWVEGLPSTAAGLSAAVSAGVPLRAAVWLHPSAHTPCADSSSARLPSTGGARPASGVGARQSSTSAAGPPAAVVYSLPGELQQLQDAVRAAAWDTELSGLLVLQLPVEDVASPFTRVPAGSSITDPAWAAASSAAARAAAAAAAAAAAVPASDTKSGAGAGSKPGSAAAGATKTSSSGSARPAGSSAAGGSASAAEAAAAALPEEVSGCKELGRILLTATDQAKRFHQWREEGVHVYRMPAPTESAVPGGSGQRMGYYQHLLDSVPPERQNVPLLLHAMMEQVQLNSLADTLPGAAAEAEQAILQVQVEGAISAAFTSLVDEQSCFVQEPCQQPGGLTLLQHGDDFAAAACGLTTGYVHSPGSSKQSAAFSHPAGAAHSSTQQQGSSTFDWVFAARGLSSQDVDAVERHMLQLLQVHGLGTDTHQGMGSDAAFDPAIERQLQQAELQSVCQGVHHATVQRSQLLQAAAAMLPQEVQAAHAADILSRSHREPLQPQVLKQVLQHASLELPHVSSMHYQPAGAELLALYAGPQLEEASSRCMPHAMTFAQYWQKLLQGSCQAPELSPQVYEMSEAAAHQQLQSKLLYTKTGGIVTTGTGGLLALHQGPTTVRLLQPEAPGKPYQLVATLQRGTVVAAAVVAAQATSTQPETPAALEPALADDGPAPRTTETDSVAAVRRSHSGSSRSNSAVASAASAGEKARPGQSHGAPPASPGRGSLDTVLEDAASQDEDTAGSSGGGGDAAAGGQAQVPSWGGLCVSTPQGLVVQLSTDGCVVMQPVKPAGTQCMQSTGVNVLGAPLVAGTLQAKVSASTSALHALLPNGTLIKAAAAGGGGDSTSAAEPEALTILHSDGTVSQQQQQDLTLSGVAGDLKQRVAGWLRTNPHGEQSWAVDVEALQHLRASLAHAAEEAAAAAARAAAAAAAAVAAEASTGKKGSKGSKKDLHKQASSKPPSAKHSSQQQQLQQQEPPSPKPPSAKHSSQQQQQQLPPQHEQAATAAAAGAGSPDPGATPREGEVQHAQQAAAAAAEAALQDLEQQPPQSMGSIRAVRLTDADTRAVVTTREDHLLLVDYPDGSRLLQDAEGCRLSHVAGAWLFEAAGLPAVRGDSYGVTLEPCPGVSLSWDAGSSCVTLVHTATGAVISLSPTGHVVYSPDGQPPEPLLECCWDLAGQQVQQRKSSLLAPDEQDSAASQHQPELPPSEQQDEQHQEGQQEQGGEMASDPAGLQGCWLTLADVCSQPDCWGLLGLDLRTGEAVLHEEEACKLHIAPGGCIKVWHNSPPVQAADEAHGQGDTAAAAGTEGQADDTAPVSAAAAAAAVAAKAAAAAAAAETEEGLTDEEVAAKKAAAEAAAQAAVEAAAAEAAAAEETAAAARALPKPVAPGIKPRLFVINPGSGAGYEVLPREAVDQFAASVSAQPGHQHMQQEALGAEEPGTICHTFLSSHAHRSTAMRPLEVAQPTQVLPLQVDPSQSLVSLRRVQTVAAAEWQAGQGLKLPRIAALNPWHLASAAGAAAGAAPGACASCELGAVEGLAATRLPGAAAGGISGPGAGGCGDQVVVVREVMELPELGPEVQEQVAAAVAAWQAHKTEQQQLLLARAPSSTRGGQQQQQQQQQQEDAEAVRGMLQDAGFTTLPIDAAATTAPAAEAAEQPAASSSSGAAAHRQPGRAVGPAGAGRLEQVKRTIIDQERAAAAAQAAAHAEADARKKPYRPWVKKVGPYDNAPQKPEAGQTLKYFETQEGLTALSADPGLRSGARLTKANLSPPKPVQPASAGKQQVPGVYLASSTALCEPGAEPLDAESYAAGLAVLAGSSSPRSKVGTSVSSGTGSPPPQHAPLMHAGRLIRLGGPVVPPQQQQQQGADAIAAVGGSQASTLGCASEQLNSRSSSSSSAGKGPVLDVYGQPRVVPPALSGTYSKARAAGSINAQYLSREGPTRRAVKTSSASLVRASGKDGVQIVLRPDHLHFGSIPAGSVVHRTARLLNGSADVVRFSILRPQLPLRVLHKPAPLTPGMEATFTVELVAEEPGDFVGEVTVKTETSVFCLSVSAKVLPAAAEEPAAVMQQVAGGGAGAAGEGEAAGGI